MTDAVPLPAIPLVPPAPLPPGRRASRWAAGQPAHFPSAQRKRILVVDDEPEISSVVQEILEDEGYDVLTASDGGAALALLDRESRPPDLILLDMRMPGINGWEFAAAYRQRPGPHAPLVTMTAAHDAQRWAHDIDAAGVLGKPFELLDLLEVVERLTATN